MTFNRRNNRNNRGNNSRPANRPARVARNNNQQSSRKFRAISQIFFQEDAPVGTTGVQGGFAFTSTLSAYQGSEFVSNNFEEYKISNVEVLMKPSGGVLTTPTNTQEAILYQNSIYSAMNSTYVQSFIDYDTNVNPTFTECQQRPNLKVRALQPNNWTKIASYTPRSVSNQSASGSGPSTMFQNQWMSTNNLGVELFGVRGLCSNTAPVFDTQDNVMSVDVRLTITVHMKGPKNSTATSALLSILPSSHPVPSGQDDWTVSDEKQDGDKPDGHSEDQSPKARSLSDL